EENPIHQAVMFQCQLRTLERGLQIGPAARVPQAITGVDVIDPGTFERGPVEIFVARIPECLAGLKEGRADRMRLIPHGRDTHTPVRTVIFRIAERMRFKPLVVRQYILERPAGIAARSPVVEVTSLAPNIDHGIDGAAAALDLAPWTVQRTVVE